jgi:hypothetical protein
MEGVKSTWYIIRTFANVTMYSQHNNNKKHGKTGVQIETRLSPGKSLVLKNIWYTNKVTTVWYFKCGRGSLGEEREKVFFLKRAENH